MMPARSLRERVLFKLATVIDPETGVDVLRMRLIEELTADEERGVVRYRFRPSSPLCPLAVTLALQIKQAVAEVEGVKEQEIEVVGYVGADELNALLKGDVAPWYSVSHNLRGESEALPGRSRGERPFASTCWGSSGKTPTSWGVQALQIATSLTK